MRRRRILLALTLQPIVALALLMCGGCASPHSAQRSQYVGTWKLATLDAPASVAPQPIYLALHAGGTCSYNRHFASGDFNTAVQSDYFWHYTNGAVRIHLVDFVRATNRVVSFSLPGRLQGDRLVFEADPFIAPFNYPSRYERLPDSAAGSMWVFSSRSTGSATTNWAETAWRQRVDAVIKAEAGGEAPPKRHTTWATYWRERSSNIEALKREGRLPAVLGPSSMLEGMLPYIQVRRKALGLPPFD